MSTTGTIYKTSYQKQQNVKNLCIAIYNTCATQKNCSRVSSPQDANSGNRKQHAFQSYPRIKNLRTTKHRPEEENSGREKL
jgi:hypothetical protein